MQRRIGFTLIELVVVVMILGILVAIAAPKMVNIMGDATDNSARQTLNAIRDAIETYASQHSGDYPPGDTEANFRSAVEEFLRGPFPKCPVGSGDDTVTFGSGTSPMSADDLSSWKYNPDNGEFIINSTDLSEDGSTAYGDW